MANLHEKTVVSVESPWWPRLAHLEGPHYHNLAESRLLWEEGVGVKELSKQKCRAVFQQKGNFKHIMGTKFTD